MREAEVSLMNAAMTATGAAIIMMTHIQYRQFWYSLIMYAPTIGPKTGPRNGATI